MYPKLCKRIIFSDEKRFSAFSSSKNLLVTRLRGERYKANNVVHTKSSGASCNIWYSVGPKGKNKLFLAENKSLYSQSGHKIDKKAIYQGFDSDSYCSLLEDHALPSLQEQYGDLSSLYFQQDNASIHTAKDKLTGKRKIEPIMEKFKFKTIKWPALSPDLNVIEQVHPLIQTELDRLLITNSQPKNKHELIRLITRAWAQVDNNKVVNIYNSFLSKCEQILAVDGHNNINQ